MYPNLKLQIWRSGLRQNRLAQQLGIHETVLSRILNGYREPESHLRQRIAAILKSDEEWLFTKLPADDGPAVAILRINEKPGAAS